MSDLLLRISPPTIFPFSSSSAQAVSHSPLPSWVSQTSPGLVGRTRGCHCCLIDTILPPLIFQGPRHHDQGLLRSKPKTMTALASSNVPISGSERYPVVMSWWLADKMVTLSQQTLCRNDQHAPQGYENSRSPGTAIFMNG